MSHYSVYNNKNIKLIFYVVKLFKNNIKKNVKNVRS